MTPLVEACILPVLFLTVVLAGGVRPGGEMTVAPPSLAALVAALVLFAIYVRTGTVDPDRVMNQARTPLANLNGLVLLLTAFAASAQVFTLLVPASGLPALIVWTVIMTLLIQALAIEPDRARFLRGLLVTLGAAYTLKFIVLAALSAPADTRTGQALRLLFEGITLGAITQPVMHPAEGYLAFATVLVYLIGIAWLPGANWRMVRTIQTDALVVQEADTDQVAKVPEVPGVPKVP